MYFYIYYDKLAAKLSDMYQMWTLSDYIVLGEHLTSTPVHVRTF